MRALRTFLLPILAFTFLIIPPLIIPPVAGPAVAQSKKEPRAEKSEDLRALNRRIRELFDAGNYREAGRVAERLAAATRARYGDTHPNYANALLRQGLMYRHQARYAEAETVLRRAVEIYEGAYGSKSQKLAGALLGLGQALSRTDRLDEAEGLHRRALAIQEEGLGPEDEALSPTLNSLGIVLARRRNFADAEAAHRRALAIEEKSSGPEDRTVAVRLTNLANVLIATNRPAEAERHLRRAHAITEKALGPDHPNVSGTLRSLVRVLWATDRSAEVGQLLQRILSINERNFGPRHQRVGSALVDLALWRAREGDWAGAVAFGRRAMPILTGSAARDRGENGRDDDDAQEGASSRIDSNMLGGRTNTFRAHARNLHRAAPHDGKAQGEAYEAAQWAMQTGAADALAQMSLRFAKGGGALGTLVRDRQDLLARRDTEDRRLLAAIARHDADAVRERRQALAAIDGRLAGIDDRLGRDFKEFAELSSPRPVSLAATQALLQPNEALVLFMDVRGLRGTSKLSEESLGFLVTRETSRWFSIPLGTRALRTRVAALRCGLDGELWIDATNWPQASEEEARERTAQFERQRRCRVLVKAAPRTELAGLSPIQVLPFDLEGAHELYRALFGPIEDLIKDKHLLVVPSGPLMALPLHVLVTEPPAAAFPAQGAEYGDAAWLARRNPITVLPSVGSLRAVRAFARTGKATSSFLGVGNPLLTGPSGRDKRAWTRLSCAEAATPSSQVASRGMPGSVSRLFGGGLADVELVRRQQPLPETADELCAVAQATGAPEAAVLLGEKASETTIKAFSADGTLSNARVVHFATHGLLAGESRAVRLSAAEPALVLTPPSRPSEEDDGLLTASEVAQLRLDADWVVLSACNTAAGESDGPRTEALSGLARAFFYAGARALLVSHWAVDSQAAVNVVTRAFDEMRADAKVGRAEALRRSMLALIGRGGRATHPATWAPFVVVGEGAR
jgi:CHAT domain-containing protein/tetratricopeptide (TPR) repeat protein